MRIRSLCTVLIFTCACVVGAVAQTQAERDQAVKQATEMIRRREIPEVTLPMIKDRKFVPFVTPVTMSFNVY